jgi:hypothetical protein
MPYPTRIRPRLHRCLGLCLAVVAVAVPTATAGTGPLSALKEDGQLRQAQNTQLYTPSELAQLRRANWTPLYTQQELAQLRRANYTPFYSAQQLAQLRRANYTDYTAVTRTADEAPAGDAGSDWRTGVGAGLGCLAAVGLAVAALAMGRRNRAQRV